MESLLIGVISGLVASILYWAGQMYFRPQMHSAPLAIVNGIISIKIRNALLFRSLIDLEMALYHVTHPPSRDGKTVANHRVIPIRSQKVLEMLSARYNGRSGAWVVRSTEGLGCDLQEGDYLRLKVIASDEWFNLRRVFTFDYTKDMIATNNADYESGRSLEIRTK